MTPEAKWAAELDRIEAEHHRKMRRMDKLQFWGRIGLILLAIGAATGFLKGVLW